MADCTKKLSPKTIKAVLQAVSIPMKWAPLHDLTENNCYSGIISLRSKPNDLIGVAEDIRNSYCNSLREYIEKGMKAQTLSQIKEIREIKEEITQVRKKSRSRYDGCEW